MLDRMVRITVDEKGITASWDDDTPIPNETEGETEKPAEAKNPTK